MVKILLLIHFFLSFFFVKHSGDSVCCFLINNFAFEVSGLCWLPVNVFLESVFELLQIDSLIFAVVKNTKHNSDKLIVHRDL